MPSQAANRCFEETFGRPPEVVAAAPGRVNLIGEHTDYNEGFVLPTPIPQRTIAALARRNDRTVHIVSATLAEKDSYTLGQEQRTGRWVDYVQGLTWALAARGYELSGFDLCVLSQVPVGSGLSSSAALEVAVLRAIRASLELPIDDVLLAIIAHQAETQHVGAPVGLMDQMVCSLGRKGEALYLDTRTLTAERVPLPEQVELLVIDSGISHRNTAGGYAQRRAECFQAATLLGVPTLRDADLGMLEVAELPDPLERRARHVITENLRVLETVAALRQGDLEAVRAAFAASHRSMRDDFEISVEEVDLLVALAEAHPLVYGARLTGGGFGGAVVALVAQGKASEIGDHIVSLYHSRTSKQARVLVPPSNER